MSSLVEELERDALIQDVSVVELLRKCMVVAAKLGLQDFATWCRLEINGYKDQEIPDYRIVHGQPQVFNPYQGYQPLFFPDVKLTERFSRMDFNQPIGQIEHELIGAEKEKSSAFRIQFDPSVEKVLMDAINFRLQPFLHVSSSELRKIIDAVRNIVLEWTLKLEQDGIVGEGMSFSKEEKKKAEAVTYNTINYIKAASHSQIQIDTADSTQRLCVTQFDISELEKVVQEIKEAMPNIEIENTIKYELIAEMETLESQVKSPKPKMSIIGEALSSVRNILEGTAGSLVATGILHHVDKLLR